MSADLLHCYGIWLVDAELAASEDEAADPASAPKSSGGTQPAAVACPARAPSRGI
jgi:hypothetical protein